MSEPPTLGDVMHHPELYLAYPEIKDTTVRVIDTPVLPNGRGAALATDGTVEIAARAGSEALRSALLAVMQQLVNKIEGCE